MKLKLEWLSIQQLIPKWQFCSNYKILRTSDFKKAHKTNDPDDWKNAKLLRNKANNMNKYLKKTYCSNAIKDNVNNSKKVIVYY